MEKILLKINPFEKDLKWCAESKVQIVLDLNSQILRVVPLEVFSKIKTLYLWAFYEELFFSSWVEFIELFLFWAELVAFMELFLTWIA